MMKLLWDLKMKSDCLWVRWIHSYFIKGHDLFHMDIPNSASWVYKSILNTRPHITDIREQWDNSLVAKKFYMSKMYRGLFQLEPNVVWHTLLVGNIARPRALFFLWLTCHQKLATKSRLKKFGMAIDTKCCFCQEEETKEHLFFCCEPMIAIWQDILLWLGVTHTPIHWQGELDWIMRYCSGKGKKCGLMKMATAETIYFCWKYRNDTCFGDTYDRNIVVDNINNTFIHRGWRIRKYRDSVAQLLM
ncbi:uncharacterized protein LOC131605460 [Vicia villosa]|uniref:uncharacterized protein LOC131605460 n=1 Tax=Vicia villosa TaxID=3911 RepID=UPI00273C0E94|nr:uncharacterized protein LOC131605460 [Vicia villosa]